MVNDRLVNARAGFSRVQLLTRWAHFVALYHGEAGTCFLVEHLSGWALGWSIAAHPVSVSIASKDSGGGLRLRLGVHGRSRIVANRDARASVRVNAHCGDAHQLALALASLLIDTKA